MNDEHNLTQLCRKLVVLPKQRTIIDRIRFKERFRNTNNDVYTCIGSSPHLALPQPSFSIVQTFGECSYIENEQRVGERKVMPRKGENEGKGIKSVCDSPAYGWDVLVVLTPK